MPSLDSKYKKISGAFGGGAKKPTIEDDTGYSTAKANIIEIVSEGIIEGLLAGEKSVYLDDTPLKNSDDSSNFEGAIVRARTGTQNQSIIPGFESSQAEVTVGVEVKKSQPVTRTIINNNLDAIRIRLGTRLQEYTDDGDQVGAELRYKISIKQGNGAFVTKLTKTIEGKYSSLVEFEHEFPVNNLDGTVDTFSVRVEKITDDSEDPNLQQQLTFQAITEIVNVKLSYPNTALIAMEFKAEQFRSIPRRSYRVGGIRFRIPSNATIRGNRGLAYSGNWNGTFVYSATAVNDPAWQL